MQAASGWTADSADDRRRGVTIRPGGILASLANSQIAEWQGKMLPAAGLAFHGIPDALPAAEGFISRQRLDINDRVQKQFPVTLVAMTLPQSIANSRDAICRCFKMGLMSGNPAESETGLPLSFPMCPQMMVTLSEVGTLRRRRVLLSCKHRRNGIISRDIGIHSAIRARTSRIVTMGICGGQGLRQHRRIDSQWLWRDRARERRKVLGQENPADFATKHLLSAAKVEEWLDKF